MAEPQLSADDELFVFVDQASFWTRHNFETTEKFLSAGFSAAFPDDVPTGTVTLWSSTDAARKPHSDIRRDYLDGSLDYLQFTPNPGYFGWPSPFANRVATEYRVEYDAEVARRVHAAHSPSRLSAVFAFRSLDDCVRVSSRYGWSMDEVRRFRLLPHEGNRLSVVNMKIVSLARYMYPRGMWDARELDALWRSYWRGGGSVSVEVPVDGVNFEHIESGEIPELLIEGVLECVDEREAKRGGTE